jgi:hypothetical protein
VAVWLLIGQAILATLRGATEHLATLKSTLIGKITSTVGLTELVLVRQVGDGAPIKYVAELIGTDTDSERAIRWLIALMVLCCDPLAIALTVAASRGDPLSKATFGQQYLR